MLLQQQQQLLLRSVAGAAAVGVSALCQLTRHLSALPVSSNAGSSSHGGWSRGAIAATAAAAAALLGGLHLAPAAQADAHATAAAAGSAEGTPSDASVDVRSQRFKDWMARHGADMAAAAVRPCTGSDSGLGLFATPALKSHMTHRWLGRRLGALLLRGATHQTVPVAAIPLSLSLTLDAALADPVLGPSFAALLQEGALDERAAVVVLLMLERAKGQGSAYAPWLQLLPTQFDSPLFYNDQQLRELAGTSLAAATAAHKASLTRSWQQLQPIVAQLMQQAGIDAPAPTQSDFLWASSIFWSRALALPVTYYTDPPSSLQQQQQQQDDDEDDAEGGSGDAGGAAGGVLRIKVLEGLVPGLDFANHSHQPKCWWEVEPASGDRTQQQQHQQAGAGDDGLSIDGPSTAGSGHVVRIMANRACCPAPGEQLTISYGDKGNEELLLLYGFAQPHNPHETLMMLCPLPDEWDEVFDTRMQLLQARGLRPQYFLTASHFETVTGQPLDASPAAPLPDDAGSSSSSSSGGSSSRHRSKAARRAGSSIVPDAAWQVLEVFVLGRDELAAAAELAGVGRRQQQGARILGSSGHSSGGADGGVGAADDDAVDQRIQQLGLCMAVLTTFVRLLELKLIAQEGPEGTGSLESDLQMLAADAAAGSTLHQRQQQLGSGVGGGGGGMPPWLRHCMLYRAGQKALVRGYLQEARAELQDTLAELQALMELRGEYID